MQTSNTSASSQAEGGLVARNTIGHTTNSFTQSHKMPGATTLRLGVNGGCAGLSNASSERDKAPIIASAAMPAQPPQGALKYTKLWEVGSFVSTFMKVEFLVVASLTRKTTLQAKGFVAV
jgi:hypothetical protein